MKKNQKDKTKPPTSTSAVNPYLDLPDPSCISPEDRFKSLLNFLESGHPFTHSGLFLNQLVQGGLIRAEDMIFVRAGLPFLDSPKHRHQLLALQEIATKIMRSEIFYEGGLKGYQLGFNPETYESHPIQDLDQFIYGLAKSIDLYWVKIEGYPIEFQEAKFDEALAHLSTYIAGVKIFKGKGEVGKFRTLLRELQKLKRGVTAKPDKKIRVPKSQTKQKIADAFLKHIQAPKDILAERSAQLLREFYISAEKEGMREYFKNK
jgi:hypothetical protein